MVLNQVYNICCGCRHDRQRHEAEKASDCLVVTQHSDKIAHLHGLESRCQLFPSRELPLRLSCLSSRSGLDTLHDFPERRLPEVLLAAGAAPAYDQQVCLINL